MNVKINRRRPLFARVLIERFEPEQIGSIIIPDQLRKKEAPCIGKVVDVGPAVSEDIHIGAWVEFGRSAGTWLDQRDNKDMEGRYFICQDEDILNILEVEKC